MKQSKGIKDKKDGVIAVGKKEVKDFSEIGNLKIKLSVPNFVYTKSLDLVAKAKERIEAAHQLETEVADAVNFVYKASQELAKCSDEVECKILHDEMDATLAEIEKYLENVFNLEDKILVSAIARSYIETSLSQNFSDGTAAREMLQDLIDRKLLIKADQNGAISVGYNKYNIGNFGLNSKEVEKIGKKADEFSKFIMKLENQRRQAQVKDMTERSEISLDEAANGKNGMCILNVPPEPYTKDGVQRWRGGGYILLDFKFNCVFPIEASGSIENLVEQMVGLHVQLERRTLSWDRPPTGRDESISEIMRNFKLSFDNAQEFVKKAQALWYLIKRGIKRLDNLEERNQIKKEMAKKASLETLKFFPKGTMSEGTSLLYFSGVVNEIDEPFFLAKRLVRENNEFFKVEEFAPHLK